MNMTSVGQEPGALDANRLLLTLFLISGVYVVWNMFLALQPVLQDPNEVAVAEQVAGDTATHPAAPAASPDALTQAAVAATEQAPEQTVSVNVDVAGAAGQEVKTIEGGFIANVSSHGAQIARFELTGYGDHEVNKREDHKEGDAVFNIDLAEESVRGVRQFALQSRDGDVALDPGASYDIVEQSERKVVMSRLTASGVRVTRTFIFKDGHFGFTHEVTLKNEGTEIKTANLDLVMQGRKGATASGAAGVRKHSSGFDDRVVVVKGLVLAHEHRAAHSSGRFVSDGEEGAHDLSGLEVALEAHPARGAKIALHRASDLGREADGESALFFERDADRLYVVSVVGSEQVFHEAIGTVFGPLHHFESRPRSVLGHRVHNYPPDLAFSRPRVLAALG